MKFAHLLKESSRHITTFLFVGGFIFDFLILPDAGHLLTIWIGLSYIGVVALAIAFREIVVSRNTASVAERRMFAFLTFIIAYFSGSSLSFVCVYAIRSAAFSVSWPLLLILLLCVLANELISSHQFRFTLDVAVLIVAALFFIVFNLPIILKVQNDFTFLVSLTVATVVALLYLYFLQFTSESAGEEAPRLYALAFGIPMFMGMLYFLNVIPAVPLTLNAGAVYHRVTTDSRGVFTAVKEKDTRFLSSFRTAVHHMSSNDDGVYFFSAISAPADLTAPISHVWEYYNESTKQWEEKTIIAFTLAGGRESGYRAYSKKENVVDGLWRVSVKVGSNRIVGRVKFYIEKGEPKEELTTTVF